MFLTKRISSLNYTWFFKFEIIFPLQEFSRLEAFEIYIITYYVEERMYTFG